MSTYQTVRIRPITFAEIEALAAWDATPVQVYLAEDSRRHGRTFTPAVLTPKPGHSAGGRDAALPHRVLHATVPDTRPNSTAQWMTDPTVEVGYVVSCDTVNAFGSHSGVHLFTTPEAERTAADVQGWTDPSQGRATVYVEDPKGGREERITPTFGAQVTAGFIIEGIDAQEARERAEAALRAEFGDTMRPHAKVQSRAVPDRRVNVFTTVGKEPLALNVLSAEVSYFMRSGSAHVEEVDPAAPEVPTN